VAATTTIDREPDALEVAEPPGDSSKRRQRSPADLSRRRFTIAVVVGIAVVVVPLLWVAWDLWSGDVRPLRAVLYDNFYDQQARAMFHGRLNLPIGSEGIEAFNHDGRQYTYFGIFPSLIRMPILLVTTKLDGKLTAPSILLAWMTTALFSSLMLWRLRIIIRGKAMLGRAEAASYGVLMATVMGGSVILFLSATPFIYNEDFAWSVPLTIGSMFALLGVMERPSWGRVTASGVLILCASLDRTPTGYACVIGAVGVAGWFLLGKGGASNRRWWLPVLVAGGIGFAASCAVTYAKFGLPVGLPMADQVWASVNAHRRYFLAANDGKAFSFAFLPSTLWAYLQPFGIHFTGLFPFITPPTAPAAARAGAVLDQTYPTASIPPTMPLLFLLSCWGLVTAFRPRGLEQVRITRIVLVAAAAGTGGVLLWGYIAERYMADFMPLLVLASAVGLIDIWRRLAERPRQARRNVLGLLAIGGIYCIVANVALAAWPVSQFTPTQTAGFVRAQQLFSVKSLASTVVHGTRLPYWAPAGQLFDVNNCSGLYLSTGTNFKDVPGQQIQHDTWIPVEQSAAISHTVGFTFNRSERYLKTAVPLLKYGNSTVVLRPYSRGMVQLAVLNSGTSINWPPADGWPFPIDYVHAQYRFTAITDPNLDSISIVWYGNKMIGHYLGGSGPAVVQTTPTSSTSSTSKLPVVTVAPVPTPPPDMQLCRSLANGS
jgi:hypothetical protein